MKTKKTNSELVYELNVQIELLGEAIEEIKKGNLKYYRTIANILRMLIVKKKRTNIPLLVFLAEKNNFPLVITIDSPSGIKKQHLTDHLNNIYFISNTHGIKITNEEFILTACEQDGGSHIDHSVETGYSFSNSNILIGGLPPKVLKLKILGEHVYKLGCELLKVV